MNEDDDLFARWSRRKRRVAQEDVASEPTSPEPAADIAEPETPEAEIELLRRLDLPVPESLSTGDDFSAFMKAGVPEFLRKRALRVLWRSNPVLANLDGLNDYDDDFRSPELTQKVIATAYKVGRGFLRDLPEDEPAPADAQPAVDEPEIAEIEDEAVENGDTAVPPREPERQDGPSRQVAEGADDSAEDDFGFRPRRMSFKT